MPVWQANPIAIPHLIAALIAGAASWYLWGKREETPGAKWIIGVLLLSSWWAFTGALEICAPTLRTKILLSQLSYLGVVFAPFCFWNFVYTHTNEGSRPNPLVNKTLLSLGLTTLIITFTNDWHSVLWRDVQGIQRGEFFYALYLRGPWFWVNTSFCYGLMFCSTVILIFNAFSSTGIFRLQSWLLLLASLCPWAVSIAYILRIGPLSYLDNTPVGFVGAGLLLVWSANRFALVDATPFATRTLFERMTDPVLVLDLKGRLVQANPAALARLGLPLQHVGQPIHTLFKDYPTLLQALELKTQKNRKPVEDHGAWWDIEVSQITNSTGYANGHLFVLRDATAIQLARLRADELAKQANTANAAKSIFLAQVSHDLRTPMHAILGMAELLRATELKPHQRDNLDTITEAAEALLRLINDLLDLSRIEAGRVDLARDPFQLDDVLDPVADMLGVVARRKGLELHQWVEPGLPSGMRGDPDRLRQILLNLVGNAVKFTPTGHVSIRAALQPGTSDTLRLEIEDTGPGIPEQRLERLFEPFERLESSAEGTGLGLAIVKRLSLAMGGSVLAENRKQGGLRFIVLLPIVDESANSHFFTCIRAQLQGTRIAVAMHAGLFRDSLCHNLGSLGVKTLIWDPGTLAPETETLLVGEHELNEGPAATWRKMGRRVLAITNRASSKDSCIVPLRRRSLALALLGNESPAAGTSSPRLLTTLRVLLADDETLSRRVSEALLTHLGCAVKAVDSGDGVLECLRKSTYDLIVLDAVMPGLNGFETAAKILQNPETQPQIIAMSADLSSSAQARWKELGIHTILPKPVSLAALHDVLKEVLARKQGSSRN